MRALLGRMPGRLLPHLPDDTLVAVYEQALLSTLAYESVDYMAEYPRVLARITHDVDIAQAVARMRPEEVARMVAENALQESKEDHITIEYACQRAEDERIAIEVAHYGCIPELYTIKRRMRRDFPYVPATYAAFCDMRSYQVMRQQSFAVISRHLNPYMLQSAQLMQDLEAASHMLRRHADGDAQVTRLKKQWNLLLVPMLKCLAVSEVCVYMRYYETFVKTYILSDIDATSMRRFALSDQLCVEPYRSHFDDQTSVPIKSPLDYLVAFTPTRYYYFVQPGVTTQPAISAYATRLFNIILHWRFMTVADLAFLRLSFTHRRTYNIDGYSSTIVDRRRRLIMTTRHTEVSHPKDRGDFYQPPPNTMLVAWWHHETGCAGSHSPLHSLMFNRYHFSVYPNTGTNGLVAKCRPLRDRDIMMALEWNHMSPDRIPVFINHHHDKTRINISHAMDQYRAQYDMTHLDRTADIQSLVHSRLAILLPLLSPLATTPEPFSSIMQEMGRHSAQQYSIETHGEVRSNGTHTFNLVSRQDIIARIRALELAQASDRLCTLDELTVYLSRLVLDTTLRRMLGNCGVEPPDALMTLVHEEVNGELGTKHGIVTWLSGQNSMPTLQFTNVYCIHPLELLFADKTPTK